MTTVVDTSVLIDVLRRLPDAVAAFERRIQEQRVLAPVLVRTELLAGLRPRERPALTAMSRVIVWVPVDEALADRAGAFAARYHSSHSTIDVVDYVIAALAEALMADLWTRNLRHFPMLPGLLTPY